MLLRSFLLLLLPLASAQKQLILEQITQADGMPDATFANDGSYQHAHTGKEAVRFLFTLVFVRVLCFSVGSKVDTSSHGPAVVLSLESSPLLFP